MMKIHILLHCNSLSLRQHRGAEKKACEYFRINTPSLETRYNPPHAKFQKHLFFFPKFVGFNLQHYFQYRIKTINVFLFIILLSNSLLFIFTSTILWDLCVFPNITFVVLNSKRGNFGKVVTVNFHLGLFFWLHHYSDAYYLCVLSPQILKLV